MSKLGNVPLIIGVAVLSLFILVGCSLQENIKTLDFLKNIQVTRLVKE